MILPYLFASIFVNLTHYTIDLLGANYKGNRKGNLQRVSVSQELQSWLRARWMIYQTVTNGVNMDKKL